MMRTNKVIILSAILLSLCISCSSEKAAKISFTENDMEIIEVSENRYEFKIINDKKMNYLREHTDTIISFKINGKNIIAKGHPAHSSLMPRIDTEYYYLLDLEKKPLFIHGDENIATFHKTEKFN